MKTFYLIDPKDITIQDIKEVLNIESNEYSEESQVSLESCINAFNINPNIYFMFKDIRNNKIVSNIDICPITDECYNIIKSGKFKDCNINSNMIISYNNDVKYYNLYFRGITIRKEYRNSNGLLYSMLKFLKKKYIEFEYKGYYIKRMIML